MKMKDEIWKDIKGYEGIYKVSYFGDIKSIKRKKWNGKGFQEVKEIILKPSKNNWGYLIVSICKDGKREQIPTHRIVAETFLENSKNKPQVNHIDGNKENNHISNLEWVTYSENMQHALDYNLRKPPMKKIFCKETNEIYESVTKCAIELNLNKGNISSVLTKKRKTVGGYSFEYAN